jgi:hypothetical protein
LVVLDLFFRGLQKAVLHVLEGRCVESPET